MLNDNVIWTDDLVSTLRALWDEGLSAAEIGRRIGVGKNAVIGKKNRLKLAPRPSPIARSVEAQAIKPARVDKVAPTRTQCLTRPAASHRIVPSTPSTRAVLVKPEYTGGDQATPVTIQVTALTAVTEAGDNVFTIFRNRAGTCQWPLWGRRERPTHRYCGAPQKPGSPYCRACHAKAFVAQSGKDCEARLIQGLRGGFVALNAGA